MAILRIAFIDIARITAFDPVRLGNRCIGNWVKWKANSGRQIYAITLIPILELHWFEIAASDVADDGVGHAIDAVSDTRIAAEVGMKLACAAIIDEADISCRVLVHRPSADVEIPPVVGGKQW